MFSIAELLDSAKAKAGIDSDYRLAKVIGITHSAVTNYRTDRTLPDERVIQLLCELSGDDPDLIAAQYQSRRARTDEGRALWQRVAARLQAGVAHVLALVAVAIVSIAAYAPDTRAATLPDSVSAAQYVYYVKLRSRTMARNWHLLTAFIGGLLQRCASTLRGHVTHNSFKSA